MLLGEAVNLYYFFLQVLYDKLGLRLQGLNEKPIKPKSTSKDVLKKLANQDSPMPTIILEFRKTDYILTQVCILCA